MVERALCTHEALGLAYSMTKTDKNTVAHACSLSIPEKRGQKEQKFKFILNHIASSRPVWAT